MNIVTVISVVIFVFGDSYFGLGETRPLASPDGWWWNPWMGSTAPAQNNTPSSSSTLPVASSLAASKPTTLVASSAPSSDNNTGKTTTATVTNNTGKAAAGSKSTILVLNNSATSGNSFDDIPDCDKLYDTTENPADFGTDDKFGNSYDVVNAPPWGQELTPPEDHNPPELINLKPGAPDDTEENY